MPTQLVRRPGVDVNFRDPAASRAWITEHVRQEIKVRGQPLPKVYLLGADFVETLDLSAMSRQDAGAHVGMTFQLVRRRNNVERCFLVLGLQGTDPAGIVHTWAVVFEELDTADGRRWWLAMLEYETDSATALGVPKGPWQQPGADTDNPTALPPFLIEVAAPPPGSRAADVRDAADTWMPDIRFAFGEVPPTAPIPTDAKLMVEFAAALGAVDELLSGKLQGAIVVRIAGRSWEQWVLGDDLPADIHEMIRWIANHRLPAADGVALAQIAVRPSDEPPVAGMQVIGEMGGMFVETWAPIVFSEGPAGPKQIPTIHWWPARPCQREVQWLGVPSKAQLVEPSIE
ncbi:MAG: hypothetical protein ABMB14_25295 [Myxococcota bacterium]